MFQFSKGLDAGELAVCCFKAIFSKRLEVKWQKTSCFFQFCLAFVLKHDEFTAKWAGNRNTLDNMIWNWTANSSRRQFVVSGLFSVVLLLNSIFRWRQRRCVLPSGNKFKCIFPLSVCSDACVLLHYSLCGASGGLRSLKPCTDFGPGSSAVVRFLRLIQQLPKIIGRGYGRDCIIDIAILLMAALQFFFSWSILFLHLWLISALCCWRYRVAWRYPVLLFVIMRRMRGTENGFIRIETVVCLLGGAISAGKGEAAWVSVNRMLAIDTHYYTWCRGLCRIHIALEEAKREVAAPDRLIAINPNDRELPLPRQ